MFRLLLLFFINFNYFLALTIDNAYMKALENSSDINLSKNSINQIYEDINISEAQNYPKVDFYSEIKTKKISQGTSTPDSSISHVKEDEYQLKLKQSLYSGGLNKYDKKVNEKRLESSKYILNESKNKLAYELSQTYIELLKQRDLLNLSKESYNKNQEFFSKVKKKLINGLGTKLEYQKSKEKLEESKVNLSVQKLSYKNALEKFSYVLQDEFDSNELIRPIFNFYLPKTLNEAILKAQEFNPSIKVAKKNLLVSTFEEKRNKSTFKPKLDLIGSYKLDNTIHKSAEKFNEYELGLEINYNLYNGGSDLAKKEKTLLVIKEKKELINKANKQIKNKIKLAWNNYKINQQKYEEVKKFVYSKKEVLDSTVKEFSLGFKTLTNLLDENLEYINIKKSLISTSYDLLLAKYAILEAIGNLALNFDEATKKEFEQDELIKSILNNEKLIKKPKIKKEEIEIEELIFENKDINDALEVDTITKEDSFEEFKNSFLNAPRNNYTINLANAKTKEDARSLIKKYNLEKESFYFTFGNNPLEKIVLGVFNKSKDARKRLDALPNELKINKPVVQKIFRKQDLFYKYNKNKTINKNLKTPLLKIKNNSVINPLERKTIIVKKKIDVIKKGKMYSSFKEKFLSTPSNRYTINLATSNNKVLAQRFIAINALEDKAFSFTFGKDKKYEKIMLGIYINKNEAKKELDSLSKKIKSNQPRIEKIAYKQKLYKKYNGDRNE